MKTLLLATLTILTLSVGEIEIPIESIRSITFDKTTGTQMYVNTTTETHTYLLSDIVRISLSNVPEPSTVPSISPEDAQDAQKVLINGIVYVIREGKIFTLKGEKIQ